MSHGVTWDVDERPLDDDAVMAAIEAALAHGGRPGLTVDVVFVDDAFLASLHERWLDDPSVTDVMAFELGEEGPGPAAEVYVSVDRAREVAAGRGVGFERELALYVVHGVLHLSGHDDHEPEARARMRAAEVEVMARLGYAADDAPHELDAG